MINVRREQREIERVPVNGDAVIFSRVYDVVYRGGKDIAAIPVCYLWRRESTGRGGGANPGPHNGFASYRKEVLTSCSPQV